MGSHVIPPRSDASAGALVGSVRITHPDRVLFPDLGLTKLDLARYYDAMTPAILPHLAGRPLTLKQCAPDTDHCRFLRHSGERAPADVRVIKIQERTKIGDYMVVDTGRALLSLVQRNIVEYHTWNTRAAHVDASDRVVIDLDPGPDLAWPDVVSAARLVRAALENVGLSTWIKTTGGHGLHVVIPIVPTPWDECLMFARRIAQALEAHDARRFTTSFRKRGRERLILIDYLRNNRTNTSVCAYSVRARRGAPVSMPIAWDDLSARRRPERWTMAAAIDHRAEGEAAWAGYFTAAQHLPAVA